MNNTNQTKIALICAAQLTTNIIMRLSRNGVSGTIDGNVITRTTVGSAALNTICNTINK